MPRAEIAGPAVSPTSFAGVVGTASDGTVVGAPRRWLRLEGATLLVGSLVVFSTTGQPWWLVPLTVLVPDLLMVGYFGGTRLGARVYNLAHSTSLPAAMVGIGFWQSPQELANQWRIERRFEPQMSRTQANALRERWHAALERTKKWESPA